MTTSEAPRDASASKIACGLNSVVPLLAADLHLTAGSRCPGAPVLLRSLAAPMTWPISALIFSPVHWLPPRSQPSYLHGVSVSLQSDGGYDFAVHDRGGGASAVFEAKRRSNTSPQWATRWHENVVGRGDDSLQAHVVLVTLDRLYGWRPNADASAAPDWELDAENVFRRYFERLKIDPAKVEPRVFEEVVGLWLRDLANATAPEETTLPDDDLVALVRTGVLVDQTFA